MHEFLYTFLTVASLHLMAVMTPGPDFAVVTKNALVYPRRLALYTSLGIALGIAVHCTYCVLGLAIVISKSIIMFNIIKYLGAAYLVYLGVKIWLPHKKLIASSTTDTKISPTISTWQALKEGFLCNLLNPKATLFTLGLFTLAIRPDMAWWEKSFFGIWMVVITFLWFAFISTVITNPSVRAKILRAQPIITKIMGVFLIIFGIELAIYQL